MDEVAHFDDPVSLVVAYLDGPAGVPVRTRVPNPRSPGFVLVSLAGGARRTRVSDTPLLTLEIWDDDDTVARDRGQLVRSLLQQMKYDRTVPVYRVREASGLVKVEDPDESGQHRYRLMVEPHIRGEALRTGS